jgi:hypothetical protein
MAAFYFRLICIDSNQPQIPAGLADRGTSRVICLPHLHLRLACCQAAACLSGPAATVQPRRLPDPVGCAAAADLARPLNRPRPAWGWSAGKHASGLSAVSEAGAVSLGELGLRVAASAATRPRSSSSC